ncbi:MAG: hypothetical protein HZC40_15195 [Chloroflexi bacterium]|nr:hypothetical protein [Chloroflexota bacterium]
MRSIKLGSLFGLEMRVAPISFLIGSLALWIVLIMIAMSLLAMLWFDALIGSLLAVILHWVGEIAHQFGHAWGARRIGYPMFGIRLGTLGLFSTSLYPRDEPPLPARLHITRALGGPLGSFIVSLATGVIVIALDPIGGIARALAWFFLLENFFVFGLGAFLPLGFNDGSTILEWWNKR